MWRPDDWCYNAGNATHEEIGKAYEAGADAMLKALRANAERFKEWEPVGKEGYLIFVPLE